MALSTYIEAEYEDGFILREDEADVSPYDETRNVFHAILVGAAEAEHGRCVRFSLITPRARHDVDWTVLPDNARPIRFKHMERDSIDGVWGDSRTMSIDFGYQYTDSAGRNVQYVTEFA